MQIRHASAKDPGGLGQTPQVFSNTETGYNNDLAHWAEQAGYKGILAEGWDKFWTRVSANLSTDQVIHDIKLVVKKLSAQ